MKKGQTRASQIRETKRAEVLKALKARGLIQKVIDTADELADLKTPMESVEVQRLKAATDTRLALIKKYLPDIKQTELVGEEGADIKTVTRVERVIVDAKDPDS
jgi:hypothetical protein